MERGSRVVLVGSGADAAICNELDLSSMIVCAINNAWRVPRRLDYHIYAGDWERGDEYVAFGLSAARQISYKDYDNETQHERFGRQELGIGATMFFNAAYWCLGYLEPAEMYFTGCSMDYPRGEANTFYGGGTADPLRFDEAKIMRWFERFGGIALARGCKLINLGSRHGLMPW